MYAVCKNGNCAQTYKVEDIIKGRSSEVFMNDIRITNGYKCEKCGSIVIEKDGTGMFSGNPTVMKYIRTEDLEVEKKKRKKEIKRKIKEAKVELKRIEEDY